MSVAVEALAKTDSENERKVKKQEKPEYSEEAYSKGAMFIPQIGVTLITEMLKPQKGEKVLDIGCGEGSLAQNIKEITQEQVVGVDFSQSMVDKCVSRGLEAYQLDAHFVGDRFPENSFDAVFSNATLHWLKRNPQQVVEGVYKILKPGGRFVAEMGSWGNTTSLQVGLEAAFQVYAGKSAIDSNPWRFPTQLDYQRLLEKAGFEIEEIKTFQRPTLLKGGMMDILSVHCGMFWHDQSDEKIKEMSDFVVKITEPYLRASDGQVYLDHYRLRFIAKRP